MGAGGRSELKEMQALAQFDRVTEWKKDEWSNERGYVVNLVDYLECAKILHGDAGAETEEEKKGGE